MTHESLPSHAAAALQSDQTKLQELATDVENVELHNLSMTAQHAQDVAERVVTTLSESEIESALETINDPPLDTSRLEFSIRELRGLDKAIQQTHGEIINNLSKLTELDVTIERENEKMNSIGNLSKEDRRVSACWIKDRLCSLMDEQAARLEAASANRKALHTQISRESFTEIQHWVREFGLCSENRALQLRV